MTSELQACYGFEKQVSEIEINKRFLALKSIQNPPSVSVIIPVYNECDAIPRTLESLSFQNFSLGTEVIVVANNCTDVTADTSRKLGATVVDYCFDPNNPYSKYSQTAFAKNLGVEIAAGEIIVTTDADAIMGPNWISALTEPLRCDQNITCVTGCTLFNTHPSIKTAMYDITRFTTRIFQQYATYNSPARGNNMAFRKADYSEIGGFDIRTFPSDDMSLGHKLNTLGRTVLLYRPEAVVFTSPRRVQNTPVINILAKRSYRNGREQPINVR